MVSTGMLVGSVGTSVPLTDRTRKHAGSRPAPRSISQRAVAVAALSTAPALARLVRVASTTSSMRKSRVTAGWACSPSEMP